MTAGPSGEARRIEGGPIAAEIRAAVAEDVASFTAAQGRPPGLAVVIIGRDAPSTVYLEQILRGCAKVGIDARFAELEGEATEASVTQRIRELNDDPAVDGVIVQMPLPPTIRLRAVIDAIDPAKDIDGIHPLNAGLLRLGYDGFLPATAHAAVEILRRSGIEIEGKDAVVIGRSAVVGMPAAFLLVKEDATVTVCHSRTRDLAAKVRGADIVVVAAGKPGLITGAMLKPGAVVVDVGHQPGRRQARRRRRLRVGQGGRLRHHAGARWRRPADQRPLVDPPHPRRRTPGHRPPGREPQHCRSPMSFPSDLDIARSVTPRPIVDIAGELGIRDDELELYGPTKAKVTLEAITRLEAERPRGKYVVVTAITPTPLGEGKSTTTVGLAQGLNKIGKRASVNIRQPSLGPVFGIKGGAAGGGYSQVIPMEDFNLHLTGDVHAIGAAHNLAGAFIDNSLHHKNPLGIDPHGILWPRVLDISDRALRNVVIGLGGKEDGVPRQTQFVITVGSEVMAVLALATDLHDLRARLGRIVLATRPDGSAVTAEDLGVAGAMTVLLRDAIKPNLLQTLEGGPAFVHCGPFANIAHGNNSIIADRLALATNDIVCTEAGFGADMGAEKFFDIKCRASGLAARRGRRRGHGPGAQDARRRRQDRRRQAARPGAARGERRGGPDRGVEPGGSMSRSCASYGIPAVVAINSFPTRHAGRGRGDPRGGPRRGRARRGPRHALRRWRGRVRPTLPQAVWAATEDPDRDFRLLYPDEAPLGEKIETIVTRSTAATGSS